MEKVILLSIFLAAFVGFEAKAQYQACTPIQGKLEDLIDVRLRQIVLPRIKQDINKACKTQSNQKSCIEKANKKIPVWVKQTINRSKNSLITSCTKTFPQLKPSNCAFMFIYPKELQNKVRQCNRFS